VDFRQCPERDTGGLALSDRHWGSVTNTTNPAPLPPPLLSRSQQAQVETDEANARKAAADADISALQLAQAKYKPLVPDLIGVATNAIDDKSSDVAFSGLVTYSALNRTMNPFHLPMPPRGSAIRGRPWRAVRRAIGSSVASAGSAST
jgi:hypothetical protein